MVDISACEKIDCRPTSTGVLLHIDSTTYAVVPHHPGQPRAKSALPTRISQGRSENIHSIDRWILVGRNFSQGKSDPGDEIFIVCRSKGLLRNRIRRDYREKILLWPEAYSGTKRTPILVFTEH